MGFYLRKSVRLGPLRFNLSKSGIGTSVGVTGFRIGTGPRGNYVHMGRGGLYYRSTLPSSSTSGPRPALPPHLPSVDVHADALTEIESASVLGMTDNSSEGLLRSGGQSRCWGSAAF